MSLDNSQRLLFRDAMATLSAAVNIVITDGDAGRGGLPPLSVLSRIRRRPCWCASTAAVCSVRCSEPTGVCVSMCSPMNIRHWRVILPE